MTGKLFLIPVPLGPMTTEACHNALTPSVLETVRHLTHFVAENAKTARAFLKAAQTPHPLASLNITELNEHSTPAALEPLLAPLKDGFDVGLLSEAGCPAVADPGANLVDLAHHNQIEVIPLIGPSSLLLALMGSGLGGQRFVFHGYLAAQSDARIQHIKTLEKTSRQGKQTQLFIETPYRNQAMFESLLQHCQPSTKICLATDLTLSTQSITTRTAGEWKRVPPPDLHRRPTVFLLLA